MARGAGLLGFKNLDFACDLTDPNTYFYGINAVFMRFPSNDSH
jgi:hypothetical protein